MGAEPAAPVPATEAVVLSPFEVNSSKDTSYGATNSLTATRIASAIKETPLAITVMTEEFLKDTGATNSFTDAFRYVPSVVPDARSEGEGPGIFGSFIGYARGFPLNAVMRNGVARTAGFSLRNVERVEFLKGPVSVFFGAAEPGGTVNYITKKPKMRSYNHIELGVRTYELSEHETDQQHTNYTDATLEHEGVIGEKLGYRIYNYVGDGHGWRDREYRREWTFSPSLLWQASPRFKALVEFEHSRSDSNPAAQSAIINPKYLADYANPPADVLAYHNLTVADYRSRILASSTNWLNLAMAARGNTAAVALNQDLFRVTSFGEGSYPGMPYDRASWSWQGAGNYNDSESDTFTVDLSAVPASWLTARYVMVYNELTRKWIQSFRSEANGDLTFNAASGGGDWTDHRDLRQQLDLVAQARFLGMGHKLLLGGEYADHTTLQRTALFDYANRFVPIPGRGGVTLTGLNSYLLWDPLLSPTVPDLGVAFNGWTAPTRAEYRTNAYYASWQGEIAVGSRRIFPSVGYREEKLKQVNTSASGIVSPTSRTEGEALTVGIVVELTKTINGFASYNENYKPQVGVLAAGPGVNRDTAGNLVPGLVENLPAENQKGKGTDIGFKFDTADGRFSATLNWFMVERDKLLAIDRAKMEADPRNTPGSFYPNPAPNGPLQRVDGIGFNAITFYSNSGLQRNEGFEFDTNWAPTPAWNIFTGVAYTYDSKQVFDPSLQEPSRTLLLTRRLAAAPEWKYSAWVRYRFGDPSAAKWVAGAGMRGQTSSNPRFFAADKPELMKGFTVFDANLGYTFRFAERPYTLTLKVTNLFDELYGTGVFAYAEPRTTTLQLSAQF